MRNHCPKNTSWFTKKVERETARNYIGDNAEYIGLSKAKAQWDAMSPQARLKEAVNQGLGPQS